MQKSSNIRRTLRWAGIRRAQQAAILCGIALGGCTGPSSEAAAGKGCDGELVSRIYGGIEADLDWRSDRLQCTGMPRPDGDGVRLRFSGAAGPDGSERRIAFIVGLPDLKRGETATELATTLTVIEEDAGRFFSTQENPVCWTDVERQDLIRDPDDYRISGIVYCVAPLAELNGASSISFADLRFTGHLSWGSPQ